jgi:hypothetical protein
MLVARRPVFVTIGPVRIAGVHAESSSFSSIESGGWFVGNPAASGAGNRGRHWAYRFATTSDLTRFSAATERFKA